MSTISCPICQRAFASTSALSMHFSRSDCGACRPRQQGTDAPDFIRGHDPLHLFEYEFTRRVNRDYNHLRFDKFVQTGVCDTWHALTVSWINELKSTAASRARQCSTVAASVDAFLAVFDRGIAVLNRYQSLEARQKYNLSTMKVPYIEPKPFIASAAAEV